MCFKLMLLPIMRLCLMGPSFVFIFGDFGLHILPQWRVTCAEVAAEVKDIA